MLIIYKIFTLIVYYCTLPYTFWAHIFGSRKWKDRLGYIRDISNNKDKKPIWIHASSMGEVKVLSILANHLKKQDKRMIFYITVMTETGYQRASSFAKGKMPVSFMPLDYAAPLRRFLERVKPSAAIFIETEIWPNAALELARREIPLFLANGRLSDKAGKRYRLFKSGLKKVFACYKQLFVQSEQDRARYLAIGAKEDQIQVMGSLKFDAPMEPILPARKKQLRELLPFADGDRIFIAGSTREKENEIILNIFKKINSDFANLRLILAPRHLDKIDEICSKADAFGLPYIKFSQLPSLNKKPVVIVDKMGILNDLYHISDIAFVGGTLVEIGGHNILEPVWAGIPAFFGKSTFNVTDSAEYVMENNYGGVVKDEDDLIFTLREFLFGKKHFRKKGINSDEPSRASHTAKLILEHLRNNGKDMVEDNR